VSATKLTAGWRSATWRYPIDPRCPNTRALFRGMTVEQAETKTNELAGSKETEWHRELCKRCQGYGQRNARMTTDLDRERAEQKTKRERLGILKQTASAR
jgi:hypothetical protein